MGRLIFLFIGVIICFSCYKINQIEKTMNYTECGIVYDKKITIQQLKYHKVHHNKIIVSLRNGLDEIIVGERDYYNYDLNDKICINIFDKNKHLAKQIYISIILILGLPCLVVVLVLITDYISEITK